MVLGCKYGWRNVPPDVDLKNIRKIVWNSDAVKVEKMLVYMGDQSFVSGDVRVIPWKEFSSWKLGAREDG